MEQEQALFALLADRYVMERQIGAGGMGTVFLARELKHDRQVALKVLSPEIASHLGVVRFLNEVKITAKLDHPHILTLIDSGQSDDFLWYVQPFVRGESLRAKLDREGQLPLEEALAITRQVASALHHAHQKSVIHRDIKPANILIHEGEAMVADFGIALAVTEASDSRMTATGIAIGTPQYMSPEQATGERRLDGRSDQYSLAAVCYEMLSGVTPHTATSTQALIAKLLTERPTRVRAVRNSVPPNIDAAIAKALEMTPADRFNTCAEFATALQYTPSGGMPAFEAPRKRRTALIATLGGIAILAGVGAAVMLRPSGPAVSVGRSEQVTADPGLEIQPTISPDGKLLAYAAGNATKMRIFVRPADASGGRTIPLSDDVDAVETQPRWSLDGTKILYLARGGAWIAPALGGSSQPLIPPSATSIVKSAIWSPDGTEIAFVRGDSLLGMPAGGGTTRVIGSGTDLHSCSWAPTGRWIACVSQNSISVLPGPLFGNLAPSGILLFPGSRGGGGAAVRIADPVAYNQSPGFSGDGKRLFYLSNRDGPRDVYMVSLASSGQPRGTPLRLTTGLNAKTISISRDEKRLAYTVYMARANIWSVPIPANPPPGGAAFTAANAAAVTRGSQVIQGMRVSPDHRWIVYDSDLRGHSDLYRVPIDGGAPETLLTDSVDEFAPDLSPDGTTVAFHSFRSGTRDIETKALNGGPVQQVTNTPAQESYPKWSPDGNAILFSDQSDQRNALIARRGTDGKWSLPEVVAAGVYRPQWSPDGQTISFISAPRDGDPGVVMLLTLGRGPARQLFTGPPLVGHAIWAPDGRTLYLKVHDEHGSTSFWSVSAQGGRPRELIRFADPEWQSVRNDFTTDGKRLFFDIEDRQSDIFVAQLLSR